MTAAIPDIEILERLAAYEAAESFLAFRRYMNGANFKVGWWVVEVCVALEKFFYDLLEGKKPILIIQAPPQHGKSVAVVDFIAWLVGKNPDFRIIYASFSDRLGTRANKQIQRVMNSDKFRRVFPGVSLGSPKDGYTKNNLLLEFVGKDGCFRNTTVRGSITGESLDLGVIDDPIKGREEANSHTVREKTWSWFTDDFYSRFSENAGLLMILTRWHLDDPAGRLQEKEEFGESDIKVMSYEAIAEKNEEMRKAGEPLFPEHKSLEFLLKRKSMLHPASWASLYQQSPVVLGGNLFKDEWWSWWEVLPKAKYYFIVVDTAQKKNNWNDYTDFQCWMMGVDDNIYLIDHLHERFEAPQLETEAVIFYNKHDYKKTKASDPVLREMNIEDKSSGSSLIQNLKNEKLKITAIQRNTDKVSRAFDTAPYIKAGRVFLNKQVKDVGIITDEGRSFPNGAFDDAIDNCMTAIEVAFINKTSSLAAAMEAA